MTGPYHDFLLLPEGAEGERIYRDFWEADPEVDPRPNYRAFRLRNHGIRVPSDLICYIRDTLDWVPSEHPFPESGGWAEPWCGHGLDDWGHTVISQRGAPVFRRVCQAWANLFALAPRTFRLRGLWVIDADEVPRVVGQKQSPYEPRLAPDTAMPRFTKGDYERLEFHRREVVPLLHKLTAHAEKAATGEFFILHVGM